MKVSKIDIELSANNEGLLKYLIKDLSKIRGVEIEYKENELDNIRGNIDFSLISSIVFTSLAIPAILKIFEVFLESKKIEIEIKLPKQNTTIKLSSFSKEKLKQELIELNHVFLEELECE